VTELPGGWLLSAEPEIAVEVEVVSEEVWTMRESMTEAGTSDELK